MASEWREIRLGDLVDEGVLAISDGYRVRNEELGPEGIPFVRGGDIGDGWINTGTVDHIRPELAYRVQAKLAVPGDVAFITKGTVGRAGRLRVGQPAVVFAPQVAYWRVLNREAFDPGFAFYLIRCRAFQAALDGVKTHGAMVADYVSISQQRDFKLRIPRIDTQRAIAHILGDLDDKIELNRRMSETLEAIARALFTSWFVDFDPVRAKSEGREAGLPPHLADLFPDSFEASELGEIPKGWRVRAIADLADVNARTLDRTNRLDLIDYVEISGVTRGQVADIVRYERGTEPSRARRRLAHGDTVISTVRPDRGSYFLSLFPPETLVVSTGFAVASPRDGNWAFLYSALTRPEVGDELGRLADGGAYPAVRPEAVAGLRLVSPQVDETRIAYDVVARPLYERSEHNRIENRLLASVRDSLMPKLMSGEVRTDDSRG